MILARIITEIFISKLLYEKFAGIQAYALLVQIRAQIS